MVGTVTRMEEFSASPPRADVTRNRGAILAAAAEVLAEHPAASLAEVATRAGLGRATLYRHFPNRETLHGAIRDEALALARAALAEADLEQLPVREGIRRAAQVLLPLGVRFRILLAEGADDLQFVAAREAALAPLLLLLVRGQASGELRGDVDPLWPVVVLTGALMGAVRVVAAGRVPADEMATLVADTVVEGLGGRTEPMDPGERDLRP